MNFDKILNGATGKDEIDKALAWEWLKKGIGVYKLEETDILYLQGYRYVQVKVFIEWGHQTDLIDEEKRIRRLAESKEDNWVKQELLKRPVWFSLDEIVENDLSEMSQRNEQMKNMGYIDVHFVEDFCYDKRSCHWEFQIKCSGRGGAVINSEVLE